ncbi:hypothetical protein [Phycobacter sp. K97]|uniref:hypothetical protein n=1 Tax=Phycobacter sedimenti TaxID=3133977 RepID=UPI00311DD0AD
MAEAFRDPGEEHDDSTFIMSLADALTCVFGAAIALFVIFLVLVKLDPTVSRKDDADRVANIALADSAFDRVFDSGMSVTLIFEADDCRVVSSIRLGAGERADAATEYWLSRPQAGNPGKNCRAFVYLPKGFTAQRLELVSARPARNVTMRVLVGNRYSERIAFDILPSRGTGTSRFATLSQSGEFKPDSRN